MADKKNNLVVLADFGQSFWLDYIRRSFVEGGELAHMIAEDGLRGLTPNPSRSVLWVSLAWSHPLRSKAIGQERTKQRSASPTSPTGLLNRGRDEFRAESVSGSDPVTIDLGLNEIIQRVDRNVTQEIIVTTADKAQLCLIEILDRMERRRAWIAPAGILATLIVVFPTTTFQDFVGLSKEYWKAMFSSATLGALIWLIVCLSRLRTSLTVAQIVDRLRTGSLAPPTAPVPPRQHVAGEPLHPP